MRISLFIIFTCVFQLFGANGKAQNAVIKLQSKNLTIGDLFREIEKQTDYLCVYSNSELNTQSEIILKDTKTKVSDCLEKVLNGKNLKYEFTNNYIVFSKLSKGQITSSSSQQQNKRKHITGVIVDEKGENIIGANIREKDTKNGIITDIDGKFSLNVSDNASIIISYIGYQTVILSVKEKSFFSIQLKENAKALDEVVVTALGIKRQEKALGYSVQKLDGNKLTSVKVVDVATSLTGKIAGLNVKNSTEFNETPTLTLRGESPLLVIDGVPFRNMSLRDIAPDDIESVDVLKGATASALYGARGGSGAIMITTKRGKEEGLSITVNSSTMFNAGYLRSPKVQTAYSSGSGGQYKTGDYVWGDKLDIGREALQYNPYNYKWEMQPLVSKGKDNLKNFSELSFITNNNLSITQKGKYGSFRTSLTHVYNKGQWPNEKLNKITYTVSGDMKYKNFSSEAGITYNKRFYPNRGGTGYGGNGYLYNLLVWSGCEFDVRDYKDYWVKKDELSNWMDKSWYDNPYYMANEVTSSSDYDVLNGFFNASYQIKPWLKFAVRSGLDVYTQKKEAKTPIGSVSGWGSKKGYYQVSRTGGYSTNNDILLMAEHKLGDFNFDGFMGGTIYYFQNDALSSNTAGGLIVPGYYSLNASVDPAKTSKTFDSKQVNSIYGKASVSWKSIAFLDLTGRNDWSSTLPNETRSYFYPSVAGSVVLSEFIPLPKAINFWKVRGSWTQTKNDMGIYAINSVYSISTNVWNNMTGAYTPNTMRNSLLSPSESRSYEFGTAVNLLNNRLRVDFTYYNKLNYNNTRSAGLSPTTGYTNTLINMDEEQIRKGMEVSISGDIIKNKELTWSASFNWARDRYYYNEVDALYSTKKPWVKKGERWDWIAANEYQKDINGNIIHGSDGLPLISNYATVQGFSEPDWIWGLSSSINYKNFTLGFSIDGRVGGIAHSVTDQAMWNSGAHIDSDNQWRYDEVVNKKTNYIGNGVKVISGSADYDSDGNIIRDNRVFAQNDKPVSYESYTLRVNPYIGEVRTQNLLDQTFIKLREISLSYSFPKNLCSKFKSKGASIGFVGQNLFMWTKEFRFSDPDKASENLNSPSIRYVGFNVKLDF